MANVFLTSSFVVRAAPAELDLLQEAAAAFDARIDDLPIEPSVALLAAFPPADASDPASIYDEPFPDAAATLCFQLERTDPGALALHADAHGSVDEIAELIRRCCPSALPMAFSYSVHSDKMSEGSQSGGYILVTAERVAGMNADTEGHRLASDLRNSTPLTPVMKAALEGYDDDGHSLEIVGEASYAEAKQMIYDGSIGDTLPLFILGEAHDAGEDFEAAADMMEGAASSLMGVAQYLREKA